MIPSGGEGREVTSSQAPPVLFSMIDIEVRAAAPDDLEVLWAFLAMAAYAALPGVLRAVMLPPRRALVTCYVLRIFYASMVWSEPPNALRVGDVMCFPMIVRD